MVYLDCPEVSQKVELGILKLADKLDHKVRQLVVDHTLVVDTEPLLRGDESTSYSLILIQRFMPTQGCHGRIVFSAFGQKKEEAKEENIWYVREKENEKEENICYAEKKKNGEG